VKPHEGNPWSGLLKDVERSQRGGGRNEGGGTWAKRTRVNQLGVNNLQHASANGPTFKRQRSKVSSVLGGRKEEER